MLAVGSLFSGIGGIDLGLERAGMTIRWQVEKDDWCRRVLSKHWPDVPKYEDITTLTGHELERVDVLAGGFPCQPASVAGSRKGNEDVERWLWPHFEKLIRVLRPRIVLVENVPGLFTVNGGAAFGEIIGSLASMRYDCEWDVISAADVGAPHLRKRWWCVAYPSKNLAHARHSGVLQRRLSGDVEGQGVFAGGVFCDGVQSGEGEQRESVAHADSEGLEGRKLLSERPSERTTWPTGLDERPRIFDGEIGGEWEPEPDVGRVVPHGVSRRVDRLRGLGNAVVPQIVEWIGQRILAIHDHD
jgi:DNA (cytosine-5)-methyltransferase 1